MTDKRTMDILRESGAFMEGHFILSSGRHSNAYCQCARALERPEMAGELGTMLADLFRDDGIDVVVSPALGGILLGHEVARALGVRSLFAEREDGKMTLRRGFQLVPGERVLVVEDVVTTGGSVSEVADIARTNGAEVVGFGFILDRSGDELDLGAPAKALHSETMKSYDPLDCPICAAGEEPAEKPGSRGDLK